MKICMYCIAFRFNSAVRPALWTAPIVSRLFNFCTVLVIERDQRLSTILGTSVQKIAGGATLSYCSA